MFNFYSICVNTLLAGTTFMQGQKRVSDSLELKFQVISSYMDDKNKSWKREREGENVYTQHNSHPVQQTGIRVTKDTGK